MYVIVALHIDQCAFQFMLTLSRMIFALTHSKSHMSTRLAVIATAAVIHGTNQHNHE
jgi:hypothetical protein